MSNTLQEKKSYKNIPYVYCAGKLNAEAIDYLLNVRTLMELSESVREAGMGYFCPAIDLLMGITFGYANYHDYFDNGQVALLHCDAMIVAHNWKTSTGTQAEIKLAEENDIPVFYDIKDLIKWKKRREEEITNGSFVGA